MIDGKPGLIESAPRWGPLGFGGFGVQGLVFRVYGLGFRGLLRVQGFRVQGFQEQVLPFVSCLVRSSVGGLALWITDLNDALSEVLELQCLN